MPRLWYHNRGIFGIDRGIFDTQPRTSTEAHLILNRGKIVLKIADFTNKKIGVYRFKACMTRFQARTAISEYFSFSVYDMSPALSANKRGFGFERGGLGRRDESQ